MSAVLAESARIGRFELKRELGRGAQAEVWLAFDSRLEREVAVKLMKTEGDSGVAMQWLQEARSVSRLTHPSIVPVFEADLHEGRPYLVFEYVAGRTLGQHLKARGPLPAREAVALVIDVLDALQAAHEAGVVHRDLKPSNVLVDGRGKARVMDFGIAARTHDQSNRREVVGTPGYMSPEAADGAAPTPLMDVFSAGLLLVELLHGRPLIAEREAFRAIYRVAHEDLVLPAMPAGVDDPLAAIALRAIARDGTRRLPSAAAMRTALQDWLAPAAAVDAPSANSGTLDFLLRRMRHKTDFPALSDSVAAIQRVAGSDSDGIDTLAGEILKDVALTNKLLRLVNTAHFAHAGGGAISTVSRAVALIGFAGIRNMALSLMLLEHMQDKSQAGLLKDEFLRAMMAGTLANELCAGSRDGEEAFIGAMFLNLGRLLASYYFPEEAGQVRRLVESAGAARGSTLAAEESASTSVLGIAYEDLGVGVARSWALPDTLQRCMRRPTGSTPARPVDKPVEGLRWLALASNEITEALMRSEPAQAAAALSQLAQKYAGVLSLSPKDIEAAVQAARRKLADDAQAMSLHVRADSPAARLLRHAPAEPVGEDSLTGHALPTMPVAASSPEAGRQHAADVMAAGIQDITNSMVDSFKLNEVLRMILETMYRALECRRIVFCLRDPRTDTLTGRFGLGDDAPAACAAFKIPLKGGADLFTAVSLKGADTLISDASASSIASRLPAWYRDKIAAPTFLVLPLMMKNAPFALIYADKASAGSIDLGAKELAMLRTLRNQAVMAFRQAG